MSRLSRPVSLADVVFLFLLQADYFSTVATVVFLRKENCMYQACPTQDCNKKVIDQQNGLYRCEKCDREFPNFKYRMILSVSRADHETPYGVHGLTVRSETLKGVVEPWRVVVRESQMSLGRSACCCSVNKEGFVLLDSLHTVAYVCNPSTCYGVGKRLEEFRASCDCVRAEWATLYAVSKKKNLKGVKHGETGRNPLLPWRLIKNLQCEALALRGDRSN